MRILTLLHKHQQRTQRKRILFFFRLGEKNRDTRFGFLYKGYLSSHIEQYFVSPDKDTELSSGCLTMADSDIPSPMQKTELETFWSDSRIWNDFQFRQDDIIIATFPKSGTTWMQQIVSQLIFNGQGTISIKFVSPWLDFRFNEDIFGTDETVLQILEKQTHRRFIKTHLPFEALVFSTKAKYLFVARDGRDVACSIYNHLVNVTIESPDKPKSIEESFQTRILSASFFAHIRSWWIRRHLPNVLLVHFSQLKKDLATTIKRVAEFLDIEIDPSHWDAILEHCSFDYMKNNADQAVDKKHFIGGAKTFFCQGTNDRWKGVISDEDCAIYEQQAVEELGEEGARWLRTGELTNDEKNR